MAIAFLVYLAAIALALWLLYRFRMVAWYWHGLAVLAAVGIGLAPPPEFWRGRSFDLTAGFLFVALLLWGLAAPVFRLPGVARGDQPDPDQRQALHLDEVQWTKVLLLLVGFALTIAGTVTIVSPELVISTDAARVAVGPVSAGTESIDWRITLPPILGGLLLAAGGFFEFFGAFWFGRQSRHQAPGTMEHAHAHGAGQPTK